MATDNYRGYINEVYDNIACPFGSVYLGTCGISGGIPLAFPGDDSEVLIALRSEIVFRTGFD